MRCVPRHTAPCLIHIQVQKSARAQGQAPRTLDTPPPGTKLTGETHAEYQSPNLRHWHTGPRIHCDAANYKHELRSWNDPLVWRSRVHHVAPLGYKVTHPRVQAFMCSYRQLPTLALGTALKARCVSCQLGQLDPDTADTAQK